ncbi:MAG: SRPBCC family protein [Nocardioidaceae bacterium]|nr:SRPBCC family protein [Nocardioidaceae bacterium]
MQAEFSVCVDIAARPVEVWQHVTAWEEQGAWMPATVVRRLPGPVAMVGERFVARTHLGPLGFDDPITVTAWEPPQRCEILHTGRLIRGVGAFYVEPSSRGSAFTWWERIEVPGGPLAPALWRLGHPVVRAGFGWALRRLKRQIEATS